MRRVLMTDERSQERFGGDAEKSNFAVVAADAQKLPVGPKPSAERSLAKFGETFVDLIGERVENLNLKKISFNR
jgi:hypothetical protein